MLKPSAKSGGSDAIKKIKGEKNLGKKLRGLFGKSATDVAAHPKVVAVTSQGAESTNLPVRQPSNVLVTKEGDKAKSQLYVQTQKQDNLEPVQNKVLPDPKQSDSKISSISDVNARKTNTESPQPDVWRLAYNEFRATNQELFERSLPIFVTSQPGDGSTPGRNPDGMLEGMNTASTAFDKLEVLQAEKSSLHSRSAKFRKYFEESIKLLIKAKDAIALAAAAEPFAATAFTAAGLLLPLFLKSTEENEAALEGFHFIAILMVEYRWFEKSFLASDSRADFANAACKLYVAIYEYEAILYSHLQRNVLVRFGSNIAKAGRWADKLKDLQQLDSDCKKITNAVSEARQHQWRLEERKWQEQLLRQPRLEAAEVNRRALYCHYEGVKNMNPVRASGTLEWFLRHPKFLGWRSSQSSQLLWLVADPGCGKSVLSKSLVDCKGDLATLSDSDPLVCYFFFQENNVEMSSAVTALKAFLHQLLTQEPQLYRHAARDFEEKGLEFLDDFDSLWAIFNSIICDDEVPEILCIIDGLDQCQRSKTPASNYRRKLARNIANLQKAFALQDDMAPLRKVLVASRPDPELEQELRVAVITDPELRFVLDQQGDSLLQDIELVISHNLRELALKTQMLPRVREALRERLATVDHRTYLWVKLIFEYLEDPATELTVRSIPKVLEEIPDNVSKAYARLLSKVPNPIRAKRLLQYVLAATRALSLSEINVLMHIGEDCQTLDDLELWPAKTVENSIKSTTGLLVTILDSHAYFIHSTVAKFLEHDLGEAMETVSVDPKPSPTQNPWQTSLDRKESALALAKSCIDFLALNFTNKQSTSRAYLGRGEAAYSGAADVTLFTYAATQWTYHFIEAELLVTSDLAKHVAQILFDPSRVVFKLWLDEYIKSGKNRSYKPLNGTGLMWAAYFGLEKVVQCLLDLKLNVDSEDHLNRTALSFAARHGHASIVRLLLNNNASPEQKDVLLQTPLILAVQNNQIEVTQILLDKQVETNGMDAFGRTALSYAGNDLQNLLGASPADRKDITGYETDIAFDHAILLSEMLAAIKKYMHGQHNVFHVWRPGSPGTMLVNLKTQKSTGLSIVYDSIMLVVEILNSPEADRRFDEARSHALTAFGSLSTTIETESPLFLTYLPRILAYLWSHKQCQLARTVALRLSNHCSQILSKNHPLTIVVSNFSKILSGADDAIDMYSISSSVLETVREKWSKLLGPTHPQVTYVIHVSHNVQAWFSDPVILIPSLTALSLTAVETQGAHSYAALQIRVDLARLHLTASDFINARTIAMDICEKIVDSLAISPANLRPARPVPNYAAGKKDDRSSPAPEPDHAESQLRLLPANLSMIHLFLEALTTSANANEKMGDLAQAEIDYREVLLTSRTFLGGLHPRAKRHRRNLIAFLKRNGKSENDAALVYAY